VVARWSAAGQAALATALSVYTQALWEAPPAQRYLVRRGVPQELAVRSHLGYSSGHELIGALRLRGIPLQVAWDVGLLVGTARSPQERFAGRIVIPEVRGGAIAWITGRLVESAGVPLPAGPKYMSLPGVRVLGGAASLLGHPAVLAVEGPFDWLTLVKWGLPACYVGGGGLPKEAVRLLNAARTVYVAFDRDAAGQRMAQAFARHLAGRVHFVGLPADVKDVAELGQHADGLERFRHCVRAASRHLPALAAS
jgi:DNA primase